MVLPKLNIDSLGIGVCIAIAVAIIFSIVSPVTADSALLFGDFPGFYVLGKIIADGNASNLYDLETQRIIQNNAWPEMNGSFLISVYPPSLGLLLTPIGYLSANTAKIIFLSLSTLSLLLSISLVRKESKLFKFSPWPHFALIISNPFILIGTLGGQNTAFSIAIISSGLYFLSKGERIQSNYWKFISGLILGLWLFKPQFGIFIFPALLVLQRWWALAGYCVCGIFHYLAGAFLFGPSWPIEWLQKIKQFSELNYQTNAVNQASIFGAFSSFSGPTWANFSYFAALITLIVILVYLKRIWRFSKQKDKSEILWIYFVSIPLISPQTLFYDIGISFFSLMALISHSRLSNPQRALKLVIMLQILAYFLFFIRKATFLPIFSAFPALYMLLALLIYSEASSKK